MTLDPVSSHASLVTLKIPAPINMPSSVAYDSTAPRSRRSEAESGADISPIVARAVLRALRGGGTRLHLDGVEIVQQLAGVAVARFRILARQRITMSLTLRPISGRSSIGGRAFS